MHSFGLRFYNRNSSIRKCVRWFVGLFVGKSTKKVFSCYLRRVVLFYSELRLEKIVLQFSKRSWFSLLSPYLNSLRQVTWPNGTRGMVTRSALLHQRTGSTAMVLGGRWCFSQYKLQALAMVIHLAMGLKPAWVWNSCWKASQPAFNRATSDLQ